MRNAAVMASAYGTRKINSQTAHRPPTGSRTARRAAGESWGPPQVAGSLASEATAVVGQPPAGEGASGGALATRAGSGRVSDARLTKASGPAGGVATTAAWPMIRPDDESANPCPEGPGK